jgi:hypothetical protein
MVTEQCQLSERSRGGHATHQGKGVVVIASGRDLMPEHLLAVTLIRNDRFVPTPKAGKGRIQPVADVVVPPRAADHTGGN